MQLSEKPQDILLTALKLSRGCLLSDTESDRGDTPANAIMPQHPLTAPTLTAGFFGELPKEISIYYTGSSANRKTRYFFLADDTSADEQPATDNDDEKTLTPSHHTKVTKLKYNFEIYQGAMKHQITLRSGPSHSSKPLALAGNESSIKNTPVLRMPPIRGKPGVKLVPIDSGKNRNSPWTFAAPTARSVSAENFQWRAVEPEDPKQTPLQRDLYHVQPGPSMPDEVVGTWKAEHTPILYDNRKRKHKTRGARIKLGTFAFVGSAPDVEFGSYWKLMVIMTLLKMNQTRWEALDPMGAMEALGKKCGSLMGVSAELGLGLVVGGLGL